MRDAPEKRLTLASPNPADWRLLRERHGLTQEDLARLVYRTKQAVRKWEQGRGAGDPACWHLALLLLGELGRKRNPMPVRVAGAINDDADADMRAGSSSATHAEAKHRAVARGA